MHVGLSPLSLQYDMITFQPLPLPLMYHGQIPVHMQVGTHLQEKITAEERGAGWQQTNLNLSLIDLLLSAADRANSRLNAAPPRENSPPARRM